MPAGLFGYNALGVSVTLACPLECAHCITESSPRKREEMSTAEALKYVRDAAGAVDHISVTGGEPFLKRDRLEAVVAEAKKLGYFVSVMTSAYWGTSKAAALSALQRLRERGLDMVGVSLDRFHLPYVDEQRCVNVAEAAQELQIPVAVRVISAVDDDYGQHVRGLLAHTHAEVRVNFLVALGRARDLPTEAFKSCAKPPRETCETVTAADVVPGGEVYACCGPGLFMREVNPLILGNAQKESLFDILERGLTNPFMKVINTRGPIGLLEDLQRNGHGDLIRERASYTDGCQLCLDICNNPKAVDALERLYAEPERRQDQNALQFLKMVREHKAIRAYREAHAADPGLRLRPSASGNSAARARIWGRPTA